MARGKRRKLASNAPSVVIKAIEEARDLIDAQEIPPGDHMLWPDSFVEEAFDPQPQAEPQPQPEVQAEAPRSRYDDIALDSEEEDAVYIPPHVNLEGMTKAEIATVSMRFLGRRPNERDRKEVQIAEVRRGMRAGLPGFARG